MRLLVLTNLYPPQELGGYGRSMADFAWGLRQRGHSVHVLTSDAPYLGPGDAQGPAGEPVLRQLKLRGSYEGGVKPLQDPAVCAALDRANVEAIQTALDERGPFDGVLAGNLDLLGLAPLHALLASNLPVLHHIGFVMPPFPAEMAPLKPNYQLVAASKAVRAGLEQAGLRRRQGGMIPVVYPGVRTDLFGPATTGRNLPSPLDGSFPSAALGSSTNPLRVCFAGLLMGSKGAHTLVEAMVLLHQQGIHVQGYLAGGSFQPGYREHLEELLRRNGVDEVQFVGQLKRRSLARFFSLHHVCVFPSIHPEAFGIVGAEAMASGIVLVSSGAGGAAELIEDGVSGLLFEPGNAQHLSHQLLSLCRDPGMLLRIAEAGQQRAQKDLSISHSIDELELLFNREAVESLDS